MRTKAIALLLLPVAIFAIVSAGNLNPPPGPVSPTMVDLDTIHAAIQSIGGSVGDSRIPVNPTTTPGDVTASHVISQQGSYFLTGDIVGVPGESGIRIDSDDVTLDLNGFNMVGVPGTLHGILVPFDQHRSISIYGGSITNWGGSGIFVEHLFGIGMIVRNILAAENGADGIHAGSGVTIYDCLAVGNSVDGIVVNSGEVRDCYVRANGRHGISANNDCNIIRNTVDDHNGGAGIIIPIGGGGNSNTIRENTVTDSMPGFLVETSSNVIVGNLARSATYSIVGGILLARSHRMLRRHQRGQISLTKVRSPVDRTSHKQKISRQRLGHKSFHGHECSLHRAVVICPRSVPKLSLPPNLGHTAT